MVAYCHGVFLLPRGKTLCLAIGRSKPVAPYAWISPPLKVGADALLLAHQAEVTEFEESIGREKKANEGLKERYQLDENFGAWGDAMVVSMEPLCRPTVTIESLLPLVSRAVTFQKLTSCDTEKLERSAIAAIAKSGLPPSRDGNYSCILLRAAGRRAQVLVTWVPHTGLPSYPEVRWAVKGRLPASLRKPLIEQTGNPKFDTGSQLVEDSVQIHGFDPTSNDLKDALMELQLDQSDHRDRVEYVRKAAKEQGFDAIAWFQPYHVWTEETWGIYFDARKLDDLALSFLDDFKSGGVQGSHGLAALLALGRKRPTATVFPSLIQRVPAMNGKRPTGAVFPSLIERVIIARTRAPQCCVHKGDHGHKSPNGTYAQTRPLQASSGRVQARRGRSVFCARRVGIACCARP